MHIGRGDKSSKIECLFFPPPGFLQRKRILTFDDGYMDERVLVPRGKQVSYKSRLKIEELSYYDLSKPRLVFVSVGSVTFFRNFKYLGTWISFYLRDDHYIAKRIATTNALMGAMSKIWDDNNVDTY